MLPAQRNKVDISSLSEEEQKLFRLYGKLPSKKDILSNKLKERKYFDSGDYALSKAGKASDVGVTQIGSQHPLPENIPHNHTPAPSTPSIGAGGGVNPTVSPGKENMLVKSPMGASEPTTASNDDEDVPEATANETLPSPNRESAVPVRWRSQS